MTDYGRQVQFGYFLIPNAADPLLATAREVERLGLDCIGVQDHPYQRRFVDTWTLLAMIAATTSRVGVFPDVANLPLRPPAVLAKAAASLDVLSGGRVELGLGAGGFWDAIQAYGGPRRSPGEALECSRGALLLCWFGFRNRCNEAITAPMHGGNEARRLDGITQGLANLAQTDFQDSLAHRHPRPDSREQHLFGDQLPGVGYQVLQHGKSFRG